MNKFMDIEIGISGTMVSVFKILISADSQHISSGISPGLELRVRHSSKLVPHLPAV